MSDAGESSSCNLTVLLGATQSPILILKEKLTSIFVALLPLHTRK